MQRKDIRTPSRGQPRLRLEPDEYRDVPVDPAFAYACRRYREVRAELATVQLALREAP